MADIRNNHQIWHATAGMATPLCRFCEEPWPCEVDRLRAENAALQSAVTAAETERDFWKREQRASENLAGEATRRMSNAEAKVAAALALCDDVREWHSWGSSTNRDRVRAALTGSAETPPADSSLPHSSGWCAFGGEWACQACRDAQREAAPGPQTHEWQEICWTHIPAERRDASDRVCIITTPCEQHGVAVGEGALIGNLPAPIKRRPQRDAVHQQADAPAEGGEELRTPREWEPEFNVQIADPDGWRMRDAPPFDQPITRKEFSWRMAISTCRPLPSAGDGGAST